MAPVYVRWLRPTSKGWPAGPKTTRVISLSQAIRARTDVGMGVPLSSSAGPVTEGPSAAAPPCSACSQARRCIVSHETGTLMCGRTRAPPPPTRPLSRTRCARPISAAARCWSGVRVSSAAGTPVIARSAVTSTSPCSAVRKPCTSNPSLRGVTYRYSLASAARCSASWAASSTAAAHRRTVRRYSSTPIRVAAPTRNSSFRSVRSLARTARLTSDVGASCVRTWACSRLIRPAPAAARVAGRSSVSALPRAASRRAVPTDAPARLATHSGNVRDPPLDAQRPSASTWESSRALNTRMRSHRERSSSCAAVASPTSSDSGGTFVSAATASRSIVSCWASATLPPTAPCTPSRPTDPPHRRHTSVRTTTDTDDSGHRIGGSDGRPGTVCIVLRRLAWRGDSVHSPAAPCLARGQTAGRARCAPPPRRVPQTQQLRVAAGAGEHHGIAPGTRPPARSAQHALLAEAGGQQRATLGDVVDLGVRLHPPCVGGREELVGQDALSAGADPAAPVLRKDGHPDPPGQAAPVGPVRHLVEGDAAQHCACGVGDHPRARSRGAAVPVAEVVVVVVVVLAADLVTGEGVQDEGVVGGRLPQHHVVRGQVTARGLKAHAPSIPRRCAARHLVAERVSPSADHAPPELRTRSGTTA